MPVILAIDPGTTRSAWVRYNSDLRVIHEADIAENETLRAHLDFCAATSDSLAVEMVASYGMPVGAEVFETVLWIGRFIERFGRDTRKVYRREVKMHLCGSQKANDAAIRQRIIDLWGGKAAAVGLKASPGPLYGIKSDAWSALAVAITAAETPSDPANFVRGK